MPDFAPLDLGPVHHTAYVVDDIEATAEALAGQFGAGPFQFLAEVPVQNVTSRGEPGEFVHGSAFGLCNGVPIELMKIEKMAPERASERFALTPPRFHHFAYALPADTVEAVREKLVGRGMPEYLRAQFGEDVDFTYHDASATLGHDLEIHVDSEGLRGFFALITGAAEGWDGSTDLLRSPF